MGKDGRSEGQLVKKTTHSFLLLFCSLDGIDFIGPMLQCPLSFCSYFILFCFFPVFLLLVMLVNQDQVKRVALALCLHFVRYVRLYLNNPTFRNTTI